MLAIKRQLCQADAKVAEELAAQFERELMEEQEERQRIEEEDLRFVQWLAKHENDGMLYLEKEIPEEVKTFMKILRIDRELTSLEYAQLVEYYEDTEREKREKADAMIKAPTVREFQKNEFDIGKARKVSQSEKVLKRGFTAKERKQLFEEKYDSSSDEDDKPASALNSSVELVQAQEKAIARSRALDSQANEPALSLDEPTSHREINIDIEKNSGALRPSNYQDLPRRSFREGVEKSSIISSKASVSFSTGAQDLPRGSYDGMSAEEQRKRKRKKKRTHFTASFNPMYKLGARLWPGGERCQIEMVKEGGQLEKMGLKAGSVITKLNNMKIRQCEEFTMALQVLRSTQISEAVLGWRNENLPKASKPKVDDEFNSFLSGFGVLAANDGRSSRPRL